MKIRISDHNINSVVEFERLYISKEPLKLTKKAQDLLHLLKAEQFEKVLNTEDSQGNTCIGIVESLLSGSQLEEVRANLVCYNGIENCKDFLGLVEEAKGLLEIMKNPPKIIAANAQAVDMQEAHAQRAVVGSFMMLSLATKRREQEESKERGH